MHMETLDSWTDRPDLGKNDAAASSALLVDATIKVDFVPVLTHSRATSKDVVSHISPCS
jgi:hypothetical protein